MSFTLTSGNTDDRAVVEKLTQYLTGLLFGDRWYISKTLSNQGIELITRLKKNMKNKKDRLREIAETELSRLKECIH
ncbi:MAG: hypothetical protein IRD3MM_00995 [Candidatus Midichloria mitochondrii]